MKVIPRATLITLTAEERQHLEALSRSTKSEVRMQHRSRIVLMAADGTASKWRVRYAHFRLAGLSEVGDRGADPKYGVDHQQRILAMLDQPPPAGYANWTAPLLARELGDIHEQYI